MTFKLTKHAIKLIRDQIESDPIGPDEFRQVQGMGNLFMSCTRFAKNEKGMVERQDWTYWEMYSLKIDGVVYYFHGGAPTSWS